MAVQMTVAPVAPAAAAAAAETDEDEFEEVVVEARSCDFSTLQG